MAGAFQRRGGRGELQRLPHTAALGEPKRERAVENVAGAKRIDGLDREGRRLLQRARLIQSDRAARAAGGGEESGRQPGQPFQRLAVVGDAGRLPAPAHWRTTDARRP